MSKSFKRVLVAVLVAVPLGAVAVGFDLALIGAIALAICIVAAVVQFLIKFSRSAAAGPSDDLFGGLDPFHDFPANHREREEQSIEDPGCYNPKNPALPLYLDPPNH